MACCYGSSIADFAGRGGDNCRGGAIRKARASFLLPLWEKVARTKSATDEGSVSAERTPHPASLREATLSHRGRGYFLGRPCQRAIDHGDSVLHAVNGDKGAEA